MPLIKIETSADIPDNKIDSLLKEATRIVAVHTGKKEEYVMAALSSCTCTMAGIPETAALVDIRGIGGINKQINSGICKDICSLLSAELNITPENIYLNFTDIPAQNWGCNGSTLA